MRDAKREVRGTYMMFSTLSMSRSLWMAFMAELAFFMASSVSLLMFADSML
jgi:hypothetical protein